MSWFSNLELNTLQDLFVAQLKDLYDAEHRLTEAIPKMVEAAHSPDLKQALQQHFEETETHVIRLEQAFREMNLEPEREACKAMQGLIAEGDDVLKANGSPAVKDAAIIAAAQRVEHYEMAGYGTARTFAHQLGYDRLASLLQETLDEEGNADKILTEVAEQVVNVNAERA